MRFPVEIKNAERFHQSHNHSPAEVYEFISNPENLEKWAKGVDPAKLRFVKKNDLGVLDHYVSVAPGAEIYVPMRVVSNGKGSEVIFTLFQSADMPDGKFAEDLRMVEQDLQNLKRALEVKRPNLVNERKTI